MKQQTAVFFAKVKHKDELEKIEFYAQDIQILSDLGFDVHIATNFLELRPADLFFVWWWTWAFLPITFANALKRPVIVTGTFNYWSFYSRPICQRKLIEYSVNNSDHNIAVSQLEYNQLVEKFPSAKWSYSPHIIDTEVYSPAVEQRQNVIYTTAAMVSGNAERKCIPEIIKAAKIVNSFYPGVKFVLAGKCDKLYSDMVINSGAVSYIELPGIISKKEKIDKLQQCIIYLQPSRFEGFGLGILEALSCGAPVVTSPVGAVSEVVGGSAEFVDGSSPDSIATGIIKLLKDNKLRDKLSAEGRERAKDLFSYDRRKKDIKKIVESCK